MEIRPAILADIQAAEYLRANAFEGSVVAGSLLGSYVQAHIALRQVNQQLLEGLIVAIDGERLVGIIEIATREMAHRPSLAEFKALRPLGIVRALRFLFVWSKPAYKPAPDEAYLYGLAIDPDYRRKGLALKMMDAVEEQARRYGKKVAVSRISCNNKASLALTEKRGYRQVPVPGEKVRRLINRDEGFVRVKKTLLPLD